MRITTKIVSWGKSWFPMFPRIDLDACYPKKSDGTEAEFDEGNFCSQVRKNPMILMSSDDHGAPCAFAAILIASMNDWLDANDVDDNGEKARKTTARINRRLEHGNHSYCRVDITSAAVPHNGTIVRGVKVNITT